MIPTQNGNTVLRGDLGVLFALSIAHIAYFVDRLSRIRNNRNVEYGVPFFDDLDFLPKALLLSDVTDALFDSKVTPLPKNAWHDAALTAVCQNVEETVARGIMNRGPVKPKYGYNESQFRAMVLAAFQSLYPGHHDNMRGNSYDEAAFRSMAKQLTAWFMPTPWFTIVDMEPEKRDTLMKCMGVPRDYFEIPSFGIEEMTKKAKQERCLNVLGKTIFQCTAIFTHESLMPNFPGASLR